MDQIIFKNSKTNPKIAFIKAKWHNNIVNECYKTAKETLHQNLDAEIDVFDVPGALEIPLLIKDLAKTDQYDAIIASAFIVNGGIYHHEYVSTSVLDAMMRMSLDFDIPVFSAVLTPHNFQESDAHIEFFENHFKIKGVEVADAAIEMFQARHKVQQLAVG